MKKICIFALALMMVGAAFAGTGNPVTEIKLDLEKNSAAYSAIKDKFEPTNVKMLGMGGAGIAMTDSAYSLWVNPASLASGQFQMSLPSVGVTVNHVYDVVKPGENGEPSVAEKVYEKAQKGESMTDLISEVLPILGTGKGELATVDAAASMVFPFGFGFGLSSKTTLHTYSKSGYLGTQMLVEENLSAAAGLGLKLDLDIIQIKAGATIKANVMAFNQTVSAKEVLSKVNDSEKLQKYVDEIPLAYGYSTPVDFGVTISTPIGISASAVYTNAFSSTYKMNACYFKEVESESSNINYDSYQFEISSPSTLDCGLAIEPNKKDIIKTSVAVDVVDVIGLAKELETTTESVRAVMSHLNAGIELNVISLFDIRAGFSQGYYSAGASFNLMLMRVDAAYYWKEFGAVAGQKPLDAFSIRFNLGFER